MAGGLCEKARPVLNRTAFAVIGGKIQTPDACQGQSARAHGAGLQGDIEITADQPLAAQDFGCGAHHHHFGMGGRIMIAQNPITRTGNHPAIAHQNSADRHFSGLSRLFCLKKSQIHS